MGINLFAVSVTDVDGPPRRGLRLYFVAEMLPGEISNVLENIRSKMGEQDVPAEQLKKVNTLNKNRITN